MKNYKQLVLAGAISSLLCGVDTSQAGTTAYSMYDIWTANNRLADLPVNDVTALFSSNPGDPKLFASQ